MENQKNIRITILNWLIEGFILFSILLSASFIFEEEIPFEVSTLGLGVITYLLLLLQEYNHIEKKYQPHKILISSIFAIISNLPLNGIELYEELFPVWALLLVWMEIWWLILRYKLKEKLYILTRISIFESRVFNIFESIISNIFESENPKEEKVESPIPQTEEKTSTVQQEDTSTQLKVVCVLCGVVMIILMLIFIIMSI